MQIIAYLLDTFKAAIAFCVELRTFLYKVIYKDRKYKYCMDANFTSSLKQAVCSTLVRSDLLDAPYSTYYKFLIKFSPHIDSVWGLRYLSTSSRK